MTWSRRQRHLKILELVTTQPIGTQEELAAALTESGWEVTQSSVSRDIKALGLVKVDGRYRRPLETSGAGLTPDQQRIAEGVLAALPAGDSLVVLRTPPGEANRVGVALDRSGWPELIGTLAGDDTIFVAVRNRAAQRSVLAQLNRLTRLQPSAPTEELPQ